MACRPTTLTKIEKNKKDDGYAHNKLKCEEYLYHFVEKESFPFIILRLPDVIGPYDDTGRFWAYIKWLTEFSNNPIQIDQESRQQKMSFVYSYDVADICVKLITQQKENILYKSYNISFEETITLYDFVQKIANFMDIKQPNFKDCNSASSFYPSVDCGPINISLAKDILGWNSTPLDEALQATVDFFKQSHGKYRDEEAYAEKKLFKKIKQD